MKKVGIIAAAVICVALVCAGFYFVRNRGDNSDEKELTDVQKIITRDLEQQYPPTAREVIKLYNRIIICLYEGGYTDEEFEALVDQVLALFDDELVSNNPKSDFMEAIRAEVKNYESRDRSIRTASVCDSRDVVYKNDPNNDDRIAYVTATYFIKEKKSYDRTYQQYVLREDGEDRWKILGFYKIEGDSTEDEDDD